VEYFDLCTLEARPSGGVAVAGTFSSQRGDALRGEILAEQLDDLRIQFAQSAEVVAEQAEFVATILERAAKRGDTERRLHLAAVERQVARIERINAAKLYGSRRGPFGLNHLPSSDEWRGDR
jgi:hypothetical protein